MKTFLTAAGRTDPVPPWIAIGGLLAFAAGPVAAANPPPAPEVVVTATRLPAELSVTPGAYVIDRQEIDARQLVTAAQALQTVPGLSVFSTGLFGLTSVRQRGAGADKTLVLIDGVPVNDASQPQGGFDFAGLDLDDIERIEVLSGPHASLWGSDAIGGVIAIASREPDGLRAALEGGSFHTVRGSIAAGRSTERWAFGITASETDSKGISAADTRNDYAAFGFPKLRNSEPDGTRNVTLGARGRFRLSDAIEIFGLARYNDSRTDIDGYPAANGFVLSDTGDVYDSRSELGQVRALIDAPFSLHNEISVSTYHLKRGASSEFGPYGYEADRRIFRWTVQRGASDDPVSFKAGAERMDNQATLSTGVEADLGASSGFAVVRLRPTGALTVTVSGRYDAPDKYRGVATGRVGAALTLGGGFGLEASVGQGFKTPTISETACDFCFAPPVQLKPEHAEGYDLGLSWRSADGRFSARANAFRIDVRDQITYAGLRYVNLARTRSRGVELIAEADLGGGFRIEGGYSYTDAIDAATGQPQVRVPKNSGSASLFWRGGKLDAALTVRAESSQADTDLDGFSPVIRPGFATADLAAGYALNDRVRLTARIENLVDAHYQEAFGFGRPGRTIYVGVKLAP